MATIILSEPGRPRRTCIDTGIDDILVKDAFLGVGFETESGETLSVSMRDGGFEVVYSIEYPKMGKITFPIVEFKRGVVDANGVDIHARQ